ncbi:LuxR C-terminal-related transcriptional regulator [Streptomyces sp. KR55]|uniref:LuxR C-terminal-related transcriptional regulator n=1 Tax=Streptomyces sp. KR55 TaxID=3457425 RepID=UPI003FCF1F60
MGWNWPMTGRVEELRFIAAATRAGDGPRGVVLAGAAGVGKTRLAREALAAARRRGAVTSWVTATASARGLPLGAFAGLLGAAAQDPTRILPQAVDALVTGSGRAGAVIGVDDAHLLDELSALLVHQLVLRSPATVVVTVRSGVPAPDAVTALWKDGHLDRREVRALTEAETGALLEAVLDGPVDSAGVARLWALTGGNALFLRLLVDSELEAGRMHRSGGVWRWSGRPQVPPGLAELVDALMGRLSDPVRQVVNLLALSEPLGVTLLGRLVDPAAVELAETSGVVKVERDGRRLEARLAHPLYGELQRARLGQLTARRLRGSIATALAATGCRRVDDTLRRAVLAADSDLEPDAALLTDAAHRAIQMLDLPLAERLARAAAETGGFEARSAHAHALSWLNRADEADAELTALAGLASTEQQRLAVAVPRAANLFWTAGRPAEAEEVLEEATSRLRDPFCLDVLTAVRGAFHVFQGRPREGAEDGAAALARADLPDLAVVLASFGVVGGLGAMGRTDGLGSAAARGYVAAARSFDAAAPGLGLCDLHMTGLRLAGRLHEVEEIGRARLRASRAVHGPMQLMAVALAGHAALYRGQLRTAIRRFREARAGLVPTETQGFAFRCLVNLVQALAMTGDAAAARDALERTEPERHPAAVFFEPDLMLAQAWTSAAEGAVTEAIRLAHDAATLAADRDQVAYAMYALHTAVRFGDRTSAARLAALATQVDGPRAPVAAAHAAGLAAGDADALLAVSAALEEMGDLAAAADAAAQAATVHSRADRGTAARAAAARAHRLAEECEGARTPALITAARPLPLTDREREIAMMAVHGLSNRDIAARLVVSVRTVEGHLYRIYGKLGVAGRGDLAAFLSSVGTDT